MTSPIRTTASDRSSGRATLEKAAASALLKHQISLDEYRELVKPNLTEADIAADLAIANKIVRQAMQQQAGGDAISKALTMASDIYENVGADLPKGQQALVEKAVEAAISSLAVAK